MKSPSLPSQQRSCQPLAPLLTLALLGCSQTTSPTHAPSPTPGRIDALAIGPVQSAFLAALDPSVNLVPYTGREQLDDYGMVVFDGDAHTPAQVAAQPLISQALSTGRWVLGVDLTEAHKKQALWLTLHASTCGTSAAFAMHLGYDPNGRFQAQVIEPSSSRALPRTSTIPANLAASSRLVEAPTRPGGSPCAGGATATAQRVTADAGSTSAFARTLLSDMARPARLSRQNLPAGTPPDLIYANFSFTETFSTSITGSLQGHPGTQHPNYTVNRSFTVFLNNKNNPQGDFQYVLLEQDAAANPREANEDFIAMGKKWDTDWRSGTYDDAGWFQSRMQLNLSADPTTWNLVSTSPDTANGTTAVTTGVSFEVQFGASEAGPSGSGSFTYSNSQTRDIEDWAVDNRATNTETQWLYGSRSPVDTRFEQDCSQAIRSGGCYLGQLPNDLSQDALKLYTQSVWKTPSVVDAAAGFTYWTYYEMMDLGCSSNYGFFCSQTVPPNVPIALTVPHQPPSPQGLNIDLGVVVPIPMQSVTFSHNPVEGGNTVIGTVTLSRPAKIDTPIGLSSNSQNATVLPTVTVKQGQTSATFQVLTNTNGLDDGDSTVATIQAFSAQGIQAQLTVTNPE